MVSADKLYQSLWKKTEYSIRTARSVNTDTSTTFDKHKSDTPNVCITV